MSRIPKLRRSASGVDVGRGNNLFLRQYKHRQQGGGFIRRRTHKRRTHRRKRR